MDMNTYYNQVLELALQRWAEIEALENATLEQIQAGFNCAVFAEIGYRGVQAIGGLFNKLVDCRDFTMSDLKPAGRVAYNRAMRVSGI